MCYKCSILHIHPQLLSQDSQHFTLTLAVLPSVAVPHLKRGTAALEPRHCRDLSDRWGLGVFIPFPFLPNGCLPLLPHSSSSKTVRSLSLPPLLTLSPQANSLISPSILERKGSKTRLESSSIDSQTQKSTWFMFWPTVVFVTLRACSKPARASPVELISVCGSPGRFITTS